MAQPDAPATTTSKTVAFKVAVGVFMGSSLRWVGGSERPPTWSFPRRADVNEISGRRGDISRSRSSLIRARVNRHLHAVPRPQGEEGLGLHDVPGHRLEPPALPERREHDLRFHQRELVADAL